MKGRRVATPDDLEQPGDYCGPVTGWTGGLPAVFFLKPNGARGHITSPPHEFVEEDDGTLTVRPSISDTRVGRPEFSDGWHGYLERGNWRQ